MPRPDYSCVAKTAEADTLAEDAVAGRLSRSWGCDLVRFAKYAPIDWYCVRAGRMVGVVELKCRNVAHDRYPTVFLAFRKWLALQMACVGSGVGAVFAVRFTDRLLWIPLQQVDATRLYIGGRTDRGLTHDVEPIIEVPVASMVRVHDMNRGHKEM